MAPNLSWIEKIAANILNRLPGGWKTILGLAAMAGIKLAEQVGWLPPEQAKWWYDIAVLVFGVGVFHKQLVK